MSLSKTSIRGLTTMLLVLVATAPAQAQFGRNKIQYKNHHWKVLSTPHFDVHFYDGAEAFAARAGLILEDGYAMLSEKLDETLPWRVPVILYSNHNDFLQTNVSLSHLSEGVQAFAETGKRRIVLPFTGSLKGFEHTAIHELAHIFTFQIVYNRLLDNVFSRNALFGMPLWIAEGVAEYLAVGWDPEADMFIRDAVVHDYLPDLQYAGGFMVYKAGQSVFNYIEDTYGREKVLEILDALAATRHPDAALDRTIGLSARELSKEWKKEMRKRYWPVYAERTELGDIGRRLTDHVKSRAYYNTKPVMSPDGETVAFFSDREGLMSIYLLSTFDGKVIKKLVSGHRSDRFESLHFFTSSLAWSQDGTRIAFVAKSSGRDLLYVVDAKKGRVLKKIEVRADGLASPDWSPIRDEIIVTGIFGGQTDLLLVDLDSEEVQRLTNDADDQLNPRFFPDGRRVVFTYYPENTVPVPDDLSPVSRERLREMDFLAEDNVEHGASFDIHAIDLVTGATRPLVTTAGDDDSPVVFDGGRKLLFTSDVSGTSNLYYANLLSGEYRRITDVLGGVFTPDVNDDKGRITFAAFVQGGYDIYVSDDLDGLLETRIEEPIAASRSAIPGVTPSLGIPFASLAVRTSDGAAKPREDGEGPAGDEDKGKRRRATSYDVSDELPLASPLKPIIPKDGDAVANKDEIDPTPSPHGVKATSVEGVDKPVPQDDVVERGATVSRYKLRLSPDFVGQGGGLYYSTGFGFGLANTIALSDLLGNHRMALSFNLYGDIADSDVMATYFYLKRRINYGIGVFQFSNFLNSRVTSVGESFQNYRHFKERNYGMFGLVSVPFNAFDRVDLGLQAFVSERQFYDQLADGDFITFVEGNRSTRQVIEPTLSFIHDATFFNYFGPVDGSRYNISVSQAFGFNNAAVSRSTLYLDYRRYFKLWFRNSFGTRILFAGSEGDDAKQFFLGGPTTLRGYDYLDVEGSRVALFSMEYRFPLIDALILGWPGRWGFQNVRGSTFFDMGTAWEDGDLRVFLRDRYVFQDVRADIGFGIQMYFGYLLLNFQLAWQTDLATIGHSQFHFYIGPSF